jgi:hypothetical protein
MTSWTLLKIVGWGFGLLLLLFAGLIVLTQGSASPVGDFPPFW